MYEDLIPHFEVGERVIVHPKRREAGTKPCPHCGFSPKINKYPKDIDFIGTVLGKASNNWLCTQCGEYFTDNAEGYWQILIPDDYFWQPRRVTGVPYTLLEKVKI